MKKITLVSFALTPMALFAQAPTSTSGLSFLLILLIISLAIAVWLLIREIICWYYKINKMVSNQEEIIRLLKKIAKEENNNS